MVVEKSGVPHPFVMKGEGVGGDNEQRDEMEGEMTGFDRMAAELQLQIIQQEEALYSARVLEEARTPETWGAW